MDGARPAAIPHRDIDLTRSVRALGAADTAINMGVVLVAIGLIGLPFQGAMMQNSATVIGIDPGTLYYTWMIERWWVFAAAQFVIVYPLWFFALASLRPGLGIAVWLLMIAYMFGSSIVMLPPEYWTYLSTNAGAAIGGLAGNAILFLIIFWLLLRAPLTARPLTSEQRRAARPLAPVRGYFDLLRNMFGVWPNLRRSFWSALASSLLIYLSIGFTAINLMWRLLTFGLIIVGVAFGLAIAAIGISSVISSGGSWAGLSSGLIGVGIGAAGLALLYLVGILLQFIAQRLKRAARNLSRQSLDAQIERDRRAPILFLRSFADDQVTLPKQGFWTRVLRGEPKERRLDHLLVENFTRYGPVVAIGRPGEKGLPFGAARVYVGDDVWQDKVKELAARAAHIVIVADPTPGVAWELETMLSEDYRDKTLFLAGPGQDVLANAFMKTWARQATSMRDSETFLIALFRNAGALDALHVKKPSVDAYQIALQAFFRRAA